jgi:hypothetical protein
MKTIYFHWRKQYSTQMMVPKPGISMFSNHDVHPAAFLSNCSTITSKEIDILNQQLTTQISVVAVHNISLLPKHIIDNSVVVNIQCNDAIDLIHANFLYWVKSGQYHVEYAIEKSSNNMDFYHGVYVQIITCFCRPFFLHRPGITVGFSELGNYHKVQTMLLDLANRLSFETPHFNESWYIENYKRSTEPIRLYPHILEMFRLIYFRMQEIGSHCEYHDFFDKNEEREFQSVVNSLLYLTK